jgi:lysozyme family protein
MHRRSFIARAGALAASSTLSVLGSGSSHAQGNQIATTAVNHWQELGALMAEASQLGFSTPRMSANISNVDGRDYLQVMPATVDLIDSIEAQAPTSVAPGEDIERLLRRVHALLRRVQQVERSPPTDREPGASLAVQPSRPTFESLRDEYMQLFNSCTVREAHAADVNWCVTKLTEEKNQKMWLEVAAEMCCPWYFVAEIHYMEAAFDFRAHLHNGDPLSERTVQEPKGRPPVWNPPEDWISSATDAISFDGFANQQDWSLARTLYRWESYNGFRSRRNGIHTPYLWSFSNHYSKGKFVADGVWDPNAVSKQCGTAVMLKALVERGLVSLPA